MDDAAERGFKTGIRDRFDRRAVAYEQGREADPGFQRQARWALQAAGPGGGRRILEVGCGTGSLLRPLSEAGFRTVGVDLSAAMTAGFARRAGQLGVRPLAARADAEHLPFADGSFDALVAIGLLEYLPAPGLFLRESRRVLRPGGPLLLSLPVAGSPHSLAVGAFRALPAGLRARIVGRSSAEISRAPGARPLGPGELRKALAGAGLIPGSHRFSQFVCFPWNRIAPAWSARVAGWLEPLGTRPILRRLGSQILMAATRPGNPG